MDSHDELAKLIDRLFADQPKLAKRLADHIDFDADKVANTLHGFASDHDGDPDNDTDDLFDDDNDDDSGLFDDEDGNEPL